MKRLLVFAMLLSNCDSCLPEGFRSTQKAGFERVAAARHQQCIWNNSCQFVEQCHRESEEFCLDAGYSKTCGNGEIEGSCGDRLR